MGRKRTITDKRERRYIRISDANKWELIDKLSTLEKYDNSFNQLINDALDYGLPLLIKAEFGEIEDEETENSRLSAHGKDEEFYGQVVRLLRESLMNDNIIKSLLSSLFEAKSLELKHKPISPIAFDRGCFQDLPQFVEEYELRTLKSLRE